MVAIVSDRSIKQRAPSPDQKRRADGGNTKLKKVERKAREQLTQTLQELSTEIGKLEDCDTQQIAFQSLLQRLPQLNASLVGDCFSFIERNKRPARCSTRRMLVLLVAALCKCHPLQCNKLLARITSYISTRLRDNETAVTDACGILVSAIALHVLPLCCDSAAPPSIADDATGNDTAATWRDAFESVSVPLLKDAANAVGEHAVKCVCALLRPTEFDGRTLLPTALLVAHAHRAEPFFCAVVAAAAAKLNGSTQYASFSPTFLLLKAACEVASDARNRAGVSALTAALVPFVGCIVEAIEDTFQYGPRDDWKLRKRGVELLTLVINGFGLSDDASAASAVEYFRDHLDRVRSLVLSSRQDPVSSVRDAAAATVVAFEALNKRFGGHSPVRSGTLLRVPCASLSDFTRPATSTMRLRLQQQQQQKREDACSTAAGSRSTTNVPIATTSADDDQHADDDFGDVTMDEATAPEQLVDNDDISVQQQNNNERPRSTRSTAAVSIPSLAQFVTKARVQQPSQRQQRIDPPHPRQHRRASSRRALSESQALDELAFDAETERASGGMREPLEAAAAADAVTAAIGVRKRVELADIPTADSDGEYDDALAHMSRADAALHAAQCEEVELALRLCLLEDDAMLLKQVLGVIGAPCMHTLSRATRTALCAAFLEILDGSGGDAHHDQWLVLAWLRDLALRRASVQQVDPRVLCALEQRLAVLAAKSSRAGLEAARVLAQLGL